jgi:hypothetical protein
MASLPIQGGCYCGQIRYEVTAEPKIATMCHCESCRKLVGAQSVAWVTSPKGGFAFSHSDPARFGSSPPVMPTFCGRYGTSLTYENEHRPDEIDVTTGSLDNPEDFPPEEQVHLEQRLSWA